VDKFGNVQHFLTRHYKSQKLACLLSLCNNRQVEWTEIDRLIFTPKQQDENKIKHDMINIRCPSKTM